VLASDGLDLIGDFLDEMIDQLPDVRYRDTDRVSQLVKQVIQPPGRGPSMFDEGMVSDIVGALEQQIDSEKLDLADL